MAAALRTVDLTCVVASVAVLPVVQFCRAWRWNNLLAPIGVKLPLGRLLAISSVGFMAILALPARLGELVRPALIRQRGQISAAAALGTIAVERVIDGLFVSLTVFFAFVSLRNSESPSWMMPTAYVALGIFSAALGFLSFSVRWPERTVNTAVSLTLARYYAPGLAELLRAKLASMIRGFVVLKDWRNLLVFTLWSAVYWAVNGLFMWILAMGFQDIDLSPVGAYAIMGVVAVGIMLPNSPGLIGQYAWFAMLGLSLSAGPELGLGGVGNAYANLLYGVQMVWYMVMGGLALATPYVSLSDLWNSRSMTDPVETELTARPEAGSVRPVAIPAAHMRPHGEPIRAEEKTR